MSKQIKLTFLIDEEQWNDTVNKAVKEITDPDIVMSLLATSAIIRLNDEEANTMNPSNIDNDKLLQPLVNIALACVNDDINKKGLAHYITLLKKQADGKQD